MRLFWVQSQTEDSLEWRMEIVGYTKKLDFVKYLNGDKISRINRKTPINQNIEGVTSITSLAAKLLRYVTTCYFNVQSKAAMSQLNLPHGTSNN